MKSISTAVDSLIELAMLTHGYEYNDAMILVLASLQLCEPLILKSSKPF